MLYQQPISRFFNARTESKPDTGKLVELQPKVPSSASHNSKKIHSDLLQSTKRPGSPSPETVTKDGTGSQKRDSKDSDSSNTIPYTLLSSLFDAVEAELSRLKIVALVAEFLLTVLAQGNTKAVIQTVYLLVNRLGPDYEPGLELGLGESLMIRVILECYGRSLAQIKLDYRLLGDLGTVAQLSRCQQHAMFKPPSLTISGVFESLKAISKSSGLNSQARKTSLIIKILTACDAKLLEAKFIVRSLEGKLRIGLAEKLVLIALAHAFVKNQVANGTHPLSKVTPESLTEAEEVVREAYSRVPNYELVIKAACEYGVVNLLSHCQLTPGVPLKPMLAKPTKSISEVLDRFQDQEFICEYKYDGERAQVHLLSDGLVKIFSRNSEDMSQRYPDLLSIAKDFISVQNQNSNSRDSPTMILDCEAVAWDRSTEKILPFQVLSTRKRKGVDERDITVHICLFAFDLLYFDRLSLLTHSLGERREKMLHHLKPIPGKFQFATSKTTSNLDELQIFLDKSVKDSCEGLMVKMINGHESYYEPSKRSRNWLKLKKDYLAGLGDSLDLVVIGAYHGKGKRTGAYGGFLLASYNVDTGEYESTCKIGTGFSDDDLSALYAKLLPTETSLPKLYYVYDTKNPNAQPDVWLEPTAVFEVLTADLSLSPIYKAAHQQYGRGVSLRFPRFLRLRDDKVVEDATTLTQVMELYERQASIN